MALSRGKKVSLGFLVALAGLGQIPTQDAIPSDPSERAAPIDLTSFLPTNPPRRVNILFIHHSCGGQLLADRGEDYEYARCIHMAHGNGGELRKKLIEAGYFVNEASYGSIVGEKTDLWDWEPKFRKEMDRVLDTIRNDARSNGTAINDVVVFKSCYPNNRFGEEHEHAPVVNDDANDAGVEKTLPAPVVEGEPGPAAHGESAHGESAHGESAHGESAHGESAHGESAHGESAHGEGHAESEEEPDLTVSNAKKALDSLLPLFAQHPKTLFIYMTAPPNSGWLEKQPLWKKLAKQTWRKFRKHPTELEEAKAVGARARDFNSWAYSKDGWLSGYTQKNVLVFDYYDILTDRGQSNFLVPLFTSKLDTSDEHPNYDGNMSATDAFMPFINRALQHAGLVAPQLTPAAKAAAEAVIRAAEEAAKALEEAAKAAAELAAMDGGVPDGGTALRGDARAEPEPEPVATDDHLLSPIEREMRRRPKPPKRNLKGGTLSGSKEPPPVENP